MECFKFILSPKVQKFILFVICINAITLGLETSTELVKATGPLLEIADNIALAIFVVELVCKILALGTKFFKDAWNIIQIYLILSL